MKLRELALACLALCHLQAPPVRAEPRPVEFTEEAGKVQVKLHGRPFATYVSNDDKVGRPYFTQVHAPSGFVVTRNHPPVAGQDDTDHATMHPGVWLAFGDIAGHDTWRNKARVVQDKITLQKQTFVDRNSFTVHNHYFAKDAKKPFVREESRYTVIALPTHAMMTPLTVKKGGRIVNSEGKKNEKEVRGTTPKWCEYSGVVDGKRVGMTLLIDETNIRPSYMHARDYGLLVANMFGRQTFARQPANSPILRPPSFFPMRYGLFVFAVSENEEPSAAAYKQFQQALDVPMP